jgi:hypothetical protein
VYLQWLLAGFLLDVTDLISRYRDMYVCSFPIVFAGHYMPPFHVGYSVALSMSRLGFYGLLMMNKRKSTIISVYILYIHCCRLPQKTVGIASVKLTIRSSG